MPSEIILFRTLRSERDVTNNERHDECAAIIRKNPHLFFKPGLKGVRADHEIYAGTNWDPDVNHWPKKILEGENGEYGYILVSIRHQIGDTFFYQPEEYRYDERRKIWWVAKETAIKKIVIEEVREALKKERLFGFI